MQKCLTVDQYLGAAIHFGYAKKILFSLSITKQLAGRYYKVIIREPYWQYGYYDILTFGEYEQKYRNIYKFCGVPMIKHFEPDQGAIPVRRIIINTPNYWLRYADDMPAAFSRTTAHFEFEKIVDLSALKEREMVDLGFYGDGKKGWTLPWEFDHQDQLSALKRMYQKVELKPKMGLFKITTA